MKSKRKTLLEQVEKLRTKGFKIEYKKRQDRGIVVISINGRKYSNKKGNAQVRKLTGGSLSRKTREAISERKKKNYIPPSLKKLLRKAQRLRRERRKVNPKDATGTYTTKHVRKNIKDFGTKEAKRLLYETTRYERGIAYTENVRWMITRLGESEERIGQYAKLKKLIKKNMNKIKEKDISTLHGVIYDLEGGKINKDEAYKIIEEILNKQQ